MRRCKQIAIKNLFGDELSDEEMPIELEEDDVAAMNSVLVEDLDNENMPEDNDSVISDAEEWAFFEDEPDNLEESDEDYAPPCLMISPDGTEWQTEIPLAGRRPVCNIFDDRFGYRKGIHPQNRKESFHTVMETIIADSLCYTNLAGKTLVWSFDNL